jgi:hypothetical protein
VNTISFHLREKYSCFDFPNEDVNRIHPEQKGHWSIEGGKNSRNVCASSTTTGTTDKTSRDGNHGNTSTTGCSCSNGGETSLYDYARGREGPIDDSNELHARGIQGTTKDKGGVFDFDFKEK